MSNVVGSLNSLIWIVFVIVIIAVTYGRFDSPWRRVSGRTASGRSCNSSPFGRSRSARVA